MNFISPIFKTLALFAVCSLSISVGAGAPITAFNSSTSTTFSDSATTVGPDTFQVANNYNGAPASTSLSRSDAQGTETASGSADLSTGELKAYAGVDSAGAGGNSISAFARADFGDSFRAYSNNSPFAWSSNQASFSFDISGFVSLAGANNGSGFGLVIFEAGALDSYARWLAGEDTFSVWNSQVIQRFDYVLGPGQTFPDTTAQLTSFPTTVTASFTPGSDFDWAMYLLTDVRVNYPNTFNSDATGIADFAHTIGVTYQGPAGATTYAASGQFPGTLDLLDAPSEVPEPQSVAMIFMGAAGLVLIHRKRFFRKMTQSSVL